MVTFFRRFLRLKKTCNEAFEPVAKFLGRFRDKDPQRNGRVVETVRVERVNGSTFGTYIITTDWTNDTGIRHLDTYSEYLFRKRFEAV